MRFSIRRKQSVRRSVIGTPFFCALGLVYPKPRIKYGSDIVTSSALSFHNLFIPLEPMLRCVLIHGTLCVHNPPPSSDRPLLGVRVGFFVADTGNFEVQEEIFF